ncbi:PucR family transcriptional regulator [Actinomadura parmotrematis]|uniref:Helix-turn-helix domain-containing protein n=1 Tax=Actinomadura parmotrematis TaxID=2864039 RepID=A0ABS7G3U4_9ACTN|nr:helix-turn-helix domain-containing protein [Actinomadura parmotrematis]MBW8487387.1 helix-turn-helix domain-containing protein [Actinomadura parmotrematis]
MDPAAWTFEIDLPPDKMAARVPALRRYVPRVVKEAVQEIEQTVPAYVRPHDPRYAAVLADTITLALEHFIDLLERPGTGSAEILEFCWRLGAGEAREGRSLESLQTAIQIGAGVSVRRLTEELESDGLHTPAHVIAQVAQAVFGYLDRLSAAVGAGHREVAAGAEGDMAARRRHLLDLLAAGGAGPAELAEAARKAGWPLPAEAGVVALRARDGEAARPALDPDVLAGLHLAEPLLIVPDPDGPGRRAMLRNGLRGWLAAAGPAVPLAEIPRALRWARSALDLAGRGVIDADGPVDVAAHMPTLVVMAEHDLVTRVAGRLLAPLLEVRPSQRRRMAETLLALIECAFNATEVARRLHLHAQTVRYRLRHLEALFGETLHDPARRLALHMTLHAWLIDDAEGAEDGSGAAQA